MTRKKTKKNSEASSPEVRWHVHALGVLLLLIQIAFLPGAASPFRTPKASLAVAGFVFVVSLGAVGRLRRGSLSIPRGPLTIVLLALPVLQLASTLWSQVPRAAATSAAFSAVWVSIVLWMATLRPGDQDRLVTWCAIGAALSCVILVLQTIGAKVIPVSDAVIGRMRLTGLAGNPADFSMSAVLLLALLLSRLRDDVRAWTDWMLAGLLTAAIALSLTLTGYVALGAVLLVWLFQSRSRRLWLAAGAAAVVLSAAAFSVGLDDRLRAKVRQLRKGDWYAVLTARTDGWSAASAMIQSRPLSGIGAANYSREFYPSRLAWLEARGGVGRRGEQPTHFRWAHCDPLQHVAELGLPGAAWLIALGCAFLCTGPQARRLAVLAAAAALPFLLLHYPTHLALGLAPIALVMAHLVAGEERKELMVRSTPLVWLLTTALIVAIAAVGMWQMRILALDLWRAELERRLAVVQAAADTATRVRLAGEVEIQAIRRIDRLPGAAPWLWRYIGRARLARGDANGAHEAFQTAYDLWRHEEAEFGLGLASAAQGRRNQALIHLGRVCRVNPALAHRIIDPDLRRAVTDFIEVRTGRSH